MRADSGARDPMGPSVTGSAACGGRWSEPPLKPSGGPGRAAGYLVAVGSRTARFRRRHAAAARRLSLLLLLALLLLLLTLLALFYSWAAAGRGGGPPLCVSPQCLRSAANLALSMDPTADPCTDFYQYACGRWGAEHPRPDALPAYDWFREKQARVYAQARDFLQRNDTDDDSQPRPVRDARAMFAACMDLDSLEKVGLSAAHEVVRSVGLARVPRALGGAGGGGGAADWVRVAGAARGLLGMELLVGFELLTAPRNATVLMLALGSPDRPDPFPGIKMTSKEHRSSRKRSRFISKLEPPDFLSILEEEHRAPEEKEDGDESRQHQQQESSDDEEAALYEELMVIFARGGDGGGGGGAGGDTGEEAVRGRARAAARRVMEVSGHLLQLETNSSDEAESDEESFWEWDIGEYTAAELEVATGAHGGEWARYLRGVFAAAAPPPSAHPDLAADRVLVSSPDLQYLTMLLAYLATLPPDTIELYLWVKVVEAVAAHTTAEARQAARRLAAARRRDPGPPPPEPARAFHCTTVVNDLLGMALAYAIADPAFLSETKPKVLTMIDEIKNALAHLVGRAQWMDDNTKVATYEKILAMRALVGFPEWVADAGALERHYAGAPVSARAHLANMAGALRAAVRRALATFHRPHTPTWATDPTEVNAYHTFQENTITVPMVMLQYPFFDLGLDSLNYGSLGSILGHEITHGFDNYGRRFDAAGALRSWWSARTAAAFDNVSRCFVEQYSRYYIPELDEYVDGRRTLGENMADAGGLREAALALRRRLAPPRAPPPALPGFETFSHEQLFFLSYGNLWCGSWTAGALRAELGDSHAPQRVRPAAAVANCPAFRRAWRCAPAPASLPTCTLF